eukprot:5666810-Amphidinium_carterae.1
MDTSATGVSSNWRLSTMLGLMRLSSTVSSFFSSVARSVLSLGASPPPGVSSSLLSSTRTE